MNKKPNLKFGSGTRESATSKCTAVFIWRARQVIFARAVFVWPVIDRINLAIRSNCGREQNRGTGKIATDLQDVSGCRFYRLPQDCRFVEALTDQTAIATIASEDPGQIDRKSVV